MYQQVQTTMFPSSQSNYGSGNTGNVTVPPPADQLSLSCAYKTALVGIPGVGSVGVVTTVVGCIVGSSPVIIAGMSVSGVGAVIAFVGLCIYACGE